MQDPQKIAAQIAVLNSMTPKVPNWVEAQGYHALTAVQWSKLGANTQFLPNTGMPIKVFINTATGEIRTYLATIFES